MTNLSKTVNRIKEFRQKRHLTQSKLAEALGVTQGAIQHWENGTREPTLKILKEVAAALDTEPVNLLPQDMTEGIRDKLLELGKIYIDLKTIEQGIKEVEKNLLNLF